MPNQLNLAEFYKQYFPDTAKKYPITMRVSREEEELILFRRNSYHQDVVK